MQFSHASRCLLAFVAVLNFSARADETLSLRFAERERSYRLHRPANAPKDKPAPLVIALHGGANDGASMAAFCGLNEKADSAGFIVVYPDGTGSKARQLTWNAGNCCTEAQAQNVDDVGFIAALIDELIKKQNADATRIYLTGFSNGAMLAHRIAAERPEKIAAIATVAGAFEVAKPLAKAPVPVLHFHGTADQFAPFNGGFGPRSLQAIDHVAVPQTVEFWCKTNGANTVPESSTLPDLKDDGTKVIRHLYRAEKTGADVELYTIEGGGHTWPGRPKFDNYLGRTTLDISANDVMWNFFYKVQSGRWEVDGGR